LKTKILLLSGYDAASHQYWRKTLATKLNEFSWQQLALPARHFSWRTRGSSLDFALQRTEELSEVYNRLLVTSMVDLASLRGFVPTLSEIPTIVYFHENQFVYPISNDQPNIINAQLTSIYSAICGDRLVFNSEFNRASFLQGVRALLKKLPSSFPDNFVDSLALKSQVLAVPISPLTEAINVQAKKTFSSREPITILWNHRWEYDKQPEVFFAAMNLLKARGYRFRLNVVGESFRQVPKCFETAKQELADEINTWGFQDRESYKLLLKQSDIVVSTALHDFQGLSMLEAMSAGCLPVAPDRVVYPEYIPQSLLYRTADSLRHEADNLAAKLISVFSQNDAQVPDISGYYTENLLDDYRQLLTSPVKSNQSRIIFEK